MEKLKECPRCGCDSYDYAQLERVEYVGRFGASYMSADTIVKRANKTVSCSNCGKRIDKSKVM